MAISASKILIFTFINSVAAIILSVLFLLIIKRQFWEHSIIFGFEIFVILIIFLLFEMSYFQSVFKNPGFLTKELSDLIKNEEEMQTIKEDTQQFYRKLNSAKKFVSLGGQNIKKENCDDELIQKFSKLSTNKIMSEMENIYLDYLDKKIECKKCNLVKPPRAHHCDTCGNCILKMDHHCPWIANCVGENNLKFFVLFAFYASLGLLNVHFIILVFYVLHSTQVF